MGVWASVFAAVPASAQSPLFRQLWHPTSSEVQMGRPCSRPSLTHAAARIGYLAVSQPASHNVAIYDVGADHVAFAMTIGGQGRNANQFDSPSGVAIDALRRLLFVSDTNNHRIQIFRLADADAPVSATFAKSIGRQGTGLGELDRPTALSLDGKGNLYVLDQGNARVQVFSVDLQPTRTFGSAEQLRDPLAIAATVSGDAVFVADAGLRRVQVYGADGSLREPLGKARSGAGQPGAAGTFFYPADVAISNDGTVLVTDCGDHVVQRFDPRGSVLSPWGSFGVASGALNQPRALTIDERDRVFVVDFSGRRAQVFTATGAFKSAFRLGAPSSAQK
jgi:DNA-binding beta-propeller fold protein YncE